MAALVAMAALFAMAAPSSHGRARRNRAPDAATSSQAVRPAIAGAATQNSSCVCGLRSYCGGRTIAVTMQHKLQPACDGAGTNGGKCYNRLLVLLEPARWGLRPARERSCNRQRKMLQPVAQIASTGNIKSFKRKTKMLVVGALPQQKLQPVAWKATTGDGKASTENTEKLVAGAPSTKKLLH